jgi:formylmethanofuran dehydrogenase subunit E
MTMSGESMDLRSLLDKAASSHGHLCGGMPLGIRMGIAGLRELDMIDPSKRHDLMVFAEIDRCITDAISVATGCTLGRRNLKLVNYGKFAATFVNISNGRAVRVSSRTDARDAAMRFAEKNGWILPGEQIQEFSDREKELIIKGYTEMPEEDLIQIRKVRVNVPSDELPGRPTHIVACASCGELIFDHKEIVKGERVLCRSCTSGAYYDG